MQGHKWVGKCNLVGIGTKSESTRDLGGGVSVEDGWTIYLSSTVKRWLEWDVTCFPFGIILHVVHTTRMQPGGITRNPSDGVSGLCLFIVPTSEAFGYLSIRRVRILVMCGHRSPTYQLGSHLRWNR